MTITKEELAIYLSTQKTTQIDGFRFAQGSDNALQDALDRALVIAIYNNDNEAAIKFLQNDAEPYRVIEKGGPISKANAAHLAIYDPINNHSSVIKAILAQDNSLYGMPGYNGSFQKILTFLRQPILNAGNVEAVAEHYLDKFSTQYLHLALESRSTSEVTKLANFVNAFLQYYEDSEALSTLANDTIKKLAVARPIIKRMIERGEIPAEPAYINGDSDNQAGGLSKPMLEKLHTIGEAHPLYSTPEEYPWTDDQDWEVLPQPPFGSELSLHSWLPNDSDVAAFISDPARIAAPSISTPATTNTSTTLLPTGVMIDEYGKQIETKGEGNPIANSAANYTDTTEDEELAFAMRLSMLDLSAKPNVTAIDEAAKQQTQSTYITEDDDLALAMRLSLESSNKVQSNGDSRMITDTAGAAAGAAERVATETQGNREIIDTIKGLIREAELTRPALIDMGFDATLIIVAEHELKSISVVQSDPVAIIGIKVSPGCTNASVFFNNGQCYIIPIEEGNLLFNNIDSRMQNTPLAIYGSIITFDDNNKQVADLNLQRIQIDPGYKTCILSTADGRDVTTYIYQRGTGCYTIFEGCEIQVASDIKVNAIEALGIASYTISDDWHKCTIEFAKKGATPIVCNTYQRGYDLYIISNGCELKIATSAPEDSLPTETNIPVQDDNLSTEGIWEYESDHSEMQALGDAEQPD